jgi:hypothetical protein
MLWNINEIWHLERKMFVQGRFTSDNIKRSIQNRLDLVGVQVRWEGDGTEPAGEHIFFYREGNKN